MIVENVSTLKIHKLTQEQYDRELADGNIDENALYLTPDEDAERIRMLIEHMPTMGSYVGDGYRSQRIIEVGGSTDRIRIYSKKGIAMIFGAVCVTIDATNDVQTSTEAGTLKDAMGNLYLATDEDTLNAEGVTYYYESY